MKKIFFLIAFAAILTNAMAVTYTWNGGSGNWGITTNWTPEGTPGAKDDVTISSAQPITMTLDAATVVNSLSVSGGSTISFVGAFFLTLKSSLTFSGATLIKIAAPYPCALQLGNGSTAFNLVGNDASNYFTNTGNNTGSLFINTAPTSTVNLYVDPAAKWNVINHRKGTLVLKSDCKTDRLHLKELNGQVIKIDTNKTLTLTLAAPNTSSTGETNGGSLDASAPGCKIAFMNTIDLTGKMLFNPQVKISCLEFNKAGGTLTLGQAITVDKLLLTNGTINNSNFNITIAQKGTITRGAGTTTVEPIQ